MPSMARDEIDTDQKRRRRRKRQYYDAPQHDDDDIVILPSSDVDDYRPPMDPAALREARLRAMDTPDTDRQKMAHETRRVKPTKTATKVKAKTVKTTPSILRARSSFTAAKPKPRTAPSKPPKKVPEDTYQSVYQTDNPSMVDRRDFQKEHDIQTMAPKSTQTKRRSTATLPEESKLERRSTEPTLRRSSTSATTRPSIRKSTTSTRLPETLEVEEEVPKDSRPETVVSNAKSTKSQRTSVFGSLFARQPPVPERQVTCLICASDTIPVSQSAKLPCAHRMCHECLVRLFKLSVKDPAHMPPKCCNETEIDLKHVESLFSDDFKKKWNRKLKEYRAKNKIYCPKKGCGEWIQPKHMSLDENRRKVGKCPKCGFKTCATCNQKAHRARECPKDPAMKQFVEAAEQAGWRKCYSCSAMVELKEGCNHMTCRCTAEFCMVCGLKWKSCDCPWFSYRAVDDLGGDPVRHQEEMDRRQQQMREDERVARDMAGLNLRERRPARERIVTRDRDLPRDVGQFQVRTLGERRFNANFMQQARDVLTADYGNAEVAARGLLGGWLAGRGNNPPEPPPEDLDQDLQQPPGAFPVTPPPPVRRRTHRVRRT